VFWGILGFVFFTARESIWTDIFWCAVMITCPSWELPETGWSWLVTPALNGVLYAGIASAVVVMKKKNPFVR